MGRRSEVLVHDQLDALEELAKIDLGFRQLDVERTEVQEHLARLRSDVDRMRDLLEREKAQLAEAEQLRATTAQEIDDLSERIARSTHRHNVAKNTREREATARELEVLRREREERTAKVAELDAVVAQVRESLARHEADFAKLQELLASEQSEAERRLAEIDARRRTQDEARRTIAARVRPDLLRKYDTIRERKGTAVAEVTNGVCRGCHIAIPPQLFAKLHAGREIYQCPNCQRILVLRPSGSGV